jgi:hypothetical protein
MRLVAQDLGHQNVGYLARDAEGKRERTHMGHTGGTAGGESELSRSGQRWQMRTGKEMRVARIYS